MALVITCWSLVLGTIIDAQGAALAGIAIRPSPGKGLGAYSTHARAVGELVADYVGEVLTEREKDARYLGVGERTAEDDAWLASRRERGVGLTGDYILGVGNGLFIDAEDPQHGNFARYFNHNSEPNMALKTLPRGIGNRPRAWFVTTRAVQVDDELCFDYGPDYWFEGEEPV